MKEGIPAFRKVGLYKIPREKRQRGVEFLLFEPTGVAKAARVVGGGDGGVLRYATHAFPNGDELFAMAAIDGGRCAYSGQGRGRGRGGMHCGTLFKFRIQLHRCRRYPRRSVRLGVVGRKG